MMTSRIDLPERAMKIDSLDRASHFYLRDEDECIYLWEYTIGESYKYGPGNDLIINFKMGVEPKTIHRRRYRERAIRTIAAGFRQTLNPDWLRQAVLVPIPPSHGRQSEQYDDRLVRMLTAIMPAEADVREMLVQDDTHLTSRDALRLYGSRPGPIPEISR